MACADFLIWVGRTYETVEDYKLEASKQGCCRRIQGFPLEVIPGLSRVFLVHKDKREKCTQGSLFGFYYVDRVEIITNSKVLKSIRAIENPWSEDFFEEFSNSSEKYRDAYNNGNEGERINIAQKLRKRVRKSWRRSYPRRAAKGEIGDSKLTGGDSYDDKMREILSEILKELLDELLDKRDTDEVEFLSTEEHTELQGGAGCSKRRTTGALYLVDNLFREIGDSFQSRLQSCLEGRSKKDRRALIEEQKETEASTEETYPEEGVELWRICQKETLENRPSRTRIPHGLLKKAKVAQGRLFWDEKSKRLEEKRGANRKQIGFEGELVVFNPPYPLYEHLPKAAFRGYRRIDGAHLLRQLINGAEKPLIPYCPSCFQAAKDFKFSDTPSETEIVNALALELLVDKDRARNFMKSLTRIQMEALEECDISSHTATAIKKHKGL